MSLGVTAVGSPQHRKAQPVRLPRGSSLLEISRIARTVKSISGGNYPCTMNAHAHPIDTWHALVESGNPDGLDDLLADEAVMLSPVVHTPQRGKAITKLYLSAALQVFYNPSFRYVREIIGPSDAMLEFETEISGITVNGVDIIKWNAEGKIVEFKVMLRPLKAVNLIHEHMGKMLGAMKPGGA